MTDENVARKGRSTAAIALAITLGCGLTQPKGKRTALAGDDAPDVVLARVLTGHAGRERWWSPFAFRDDRRRTENWESASAIGIDLDYYAPGVGHSCVPDEVSQRIRDGHADLPGSLAHATPRGLRLIFVFMRDVTDSDVFKRAAIGAAAQTERALAGLDLLGAIHTERDAAGKNVVVVDRVGLVVDRGALVDLARMLWTPNARVCRADGSWEAEQRRAEVRQLGDGHLYDATALAAGIPRRADPADSTNADQPPSDDSPWGRVLSALARLPSARRNRKGVAHPCLFHDDGNPSAITFNSGVQTCSACNQSWAPSAWASTSRARELLGDLVDDLLNGDSAGTTASPAHTDGTSPPPEAPALLPFPESAWRGLFADYRELILGTTEYPLSAGWAACASALSVLIGRTATLPWGPSVVPPTIYTCSVGDSGKGRKSTALDDATDIMVEPLRDFVSTTGEPPILAIVNGTGSGEGFMDAVADLEWGADKANEDDQPRVQTGRRAILTIHELGALLEKIRRDQAGNMLEFLLRGFDAPRVIERRTISNGVVTATQATVVIAAATTLDYLVDNLTAGQVYAGLANRFLWFTGKRGPPISRRPKIDPQKISKFQAQIRDCLASVKGRSFVFDADGQALHDGLYDEEYKREEADGIADAGTARTDQQALRLAMLFAAADGSTTITASHVYAAWQVTHYSRAVATMVVGKLAAQNMRDAEARVRRALSRVTKPGEVFARRDVWQRLKGRHGLDAEMFNRVWEALVKASDLVPVNDRPNWFVYAGGGS